MSSTYLANLHCCADTISGLFECPALIGYVEMFLKSNSNIMITSKFIANRIFVIFLILISMEKIYHKYAITNHIILYNTVSISKVRVVGSSALTDAETTFVSVHLSLR